MVSIPEPKAGLVIAYSFLWSSEYDEGKDEGLKNRPALIINAKQNNAGDMMVIVAPITHTPPQIPQSAIEVPPLLKRHLGLDDQKSWVVLNELNKFAWPGFDLRRAGHHDKCDYGFVSSDFLKKTLQGIISMQEKKLHRIVPRDELPTNAR